MNYNTGVSIMEELKDKIWTTEDVDARTRLRRYFLSYPLTEEDEQVNRLIMEKPLNELVDRIIDAADKLKSYTTKPEADMQFRVIIDIRDPSGAAVNVELLDRINSALTGLNYTIEFKRIAA
jgi:hypothetical protein